MILRVIYPLSINFLFKTILPSFTSIKKNWVWIHFLRLNMKDFPIFMQDMEPYAVNHGPLLTVTNCVETPKAPPRRKRPQRKLDKEMQPLRRSLSFTDAHFIAQAVYEGDTKLIEELYPDFPRYAVLFYRVSHVCFRSLKGFKMSENQYS